MAVFGSRIAKNLEFDNFSHSPSMVDLYLRYLRLSPNVDNLTQKQLRHNLREFCLLMYAGQSSGFGTKAGDQQYVNGT